MQVVNALIKANKDFDLLVVPNSDHGASRSLYGTRKRYDFFVRNSFACGAAEHVRGWGMRVWVCG